MMNATVWDFLVLQAVTMLLAYFAGRMTYLPASIVFFCLSMITAEFILLIYVLYALAVPS